MNKDTIKNYYKNGLWTEKMVRNAVVKGVITSAECEEILTEV